MHIPSSPPFPHPHLCRHPTLPLAFPEAEPRLEEPPSEDKCSQMSRHRLVFPGPPPGVLLGLKIQLGNARVAQMPSEGSRVPSTYLGGEPH
ncbi:hypothetical protein P7K49_037993, partial [Saguinus oedipus]